ncbi:related to pisatin demethylase [Cephalotrichum gorgonifer]|uniref:Related to pisatin demethylase n=1 Tax=Cephalotrichum gorgonifer TaxID=2041049 RepID=A0AAE8N438_9PEZI|nr:related to pisatin demethylase [Cephalotrichum gorgonifer]
MAFTELLTSTRTLSAAGILLTLYLVGSWVLEWHRLRHIKGPFLASFSYFWILRTIASGRQGETFRGVSDKYGPLARIGPNEVLTSDPEVLRRTGNTRAKPTYGRSIGYSVSRVDPFHDSLFSTRDTVAHDKLKAKLSFGYGGRENPSLEDGIDEQLVALVDLIRRKYISTDAELRPLDLATASQYFTLDAITRVAYGRPFGFLATDTDVYGYNKMTKRVIPTVGAFKRHGVGKRDCQSEIMFQMVAGSDTTATAIRGTLLNLMTAPHVYTKLQKEIDEAAASGAISPIIKGEEGRKLPYLQAVIYEGIRMNPPFTGLALKQVPPEGDTISGQFIPGGTRVGANFLHMQRSKAIFGGDADLFRPERWLGLDEATTMERRRHVELVFGAGRWGCSGKPVALLELNKVFVELLRRFDFQLINPREPVETFNMNIVLQKNMWVRVTERFPDAPIIFESSSFYQDIQAIKIINMGYPSNYWIHMRVNNHMHRLNDLKLEHAELEQGEFYDPEQQDKVLDAEAVNHLVAKPHKQIEVAAAASGSDPGTKGGYDLYDGDTKICHVAWNCPTMAVADSFSISHCNDNYMVRYKGAHLEHGPIGDVDITVKEIH